MLYNTIPSITTVVLTTRRTKSTIQVLTGALFTAVAYSWPPRSNPLRPLLFRSGLRAMRRASPPLGCRTACPKETCRLRNCLLLSLFKKKTLHDAHKASVMR